MHPEASECARVTGGGCALVVGPPEPPRCETGVPPDTGDTAGGRVVGGRLCAPVAGPPWLGLLCAVVLLVRRVGVALLLVLPLTAHAQGTGLVGVDAQGRRALDGGPFPSLWEAELGERWTLQAALAVDHAGGLVRLVDAQGETGWLQRVTTEEVGVSVRLGDAVRVGAAFPSHTRVRFADQAWPAVPGDLALWAAVPLREAPKGLRLASRVRLDLPTGTPELYLGDADGAVRGGLSASGRLGGWEGLANLGVRLSLPTALPGLTWGSRLEAGLGLRHRLWGPTWATGELTGSIGLPPDASPGDRPLEALVHVGAVVWRGVGLSVGAGGGLTSGLGSPTGRVAVLLDARPRGGDDLDRDGLVDRRDACVASPEDPDGVRDGDGCPEEDADGDRILDEVDACPVDPEAQNGWADADGCPDAVSTVRVVVRSADPAVPLERARLTLGEPMEVIGGEPLERVRPPGPGVVRAEADGFLPAEVAVDLAPGAVEAVELALEPVRFGWVRVSLEDEEGRPLAGWIRVGGAPVLVPPEGWTVRAAAGALPVRAGAAGRLPREVVVEVPREATLAVVIALAPGGPGRDGARILTDQEIRFPLDSADPEPDSLGALDGIAALLLGDPSIRLLRVEGHADAPGSSRYNLDLSRRRAEAARDRLVALGVEPERLEAIGSGESAPGPVRAVTFTVLVWGEP